MNHNQYLEKAKSLVSKVYGYGTSPNDFYVVWFCKTLANWKALVSTDVTNGLYFEVTYNGAKAETYVDIYNKVHNTAIKDGEV